MRSEQVTGRATVSASRAISRPGADQGAAAAASPLAFAHRNEKELRSSRSRKQSDAACEESYRATQAGSLRKPPRRYEWRHRELPLCRAAQPTRRAVLDARWER